MKNLLSRNAYKLYLLLHFPSRSAQPLVSLVSTIMHKIMSLLPRKVKNRLFRMVQKAEITDSIQTGVKVNPRDFDYKNKTIGLNLYGLFSAGLGIGEAGRSKLRAARAAGIAVRSFEITLPGRPRDAPPYPKGTMWADPEHAAELMTRLVADPEIGRSWEEGLSRISGPPIPLRWWANSCEVGWKTYMAAVRGARLPPLFPTQQKSNNQELTGGA